MPVLTELTRYLLDRGPGLKWFNDVCPDKYPDFKINSY